jgi:serine protease Do
VTNNHVVTGSALLQVYVGGDSEEPLNADVLGVSECSDLAVIDIEGDRGYPALDWHGGDISTGLEVYSAGFPLGDPEFTLTRGIVSKARADGETPWSSVDSVIEHDARINAGNSGGPLVDGDGNVVGVNYAGITETDQNFAISRDEALGVIEQLRAGQDVDSIGLNGNALAPAEQGPLGIWAASVQSGSLADNAGLKPGDVITHVEGVTLAASGTMQEYCDILRSHNLQEDTLSMRVIRSKTNEVLEGQLNGRALEVVGTLEPPPTGEPTTMEPTEGGGDGGGTPDSNYTAVTDDSGALTVEVPAEWSDTRGAFWEFEGSDAGASVLASPNVGAFLSSWDEPGVFFGASDTLLQEYGVEGLLDYYQPEGCESAGPREDYDVGKFRGKSDLWVNCGGQGGATLLMVAATPEDRSFVTFVQIQIVSEADLEAAKRILQTFDVPGEL